VALPSSLMKSSQQVVVVEGSDVKNSHTNWPGDPAQIRHDKPRISEHVAIVESRNQMESHFPPCVCKNCTKQMILSLFLRVPLNKRVVIQIFSTCKPSSRVTESITLERAQTHARTHFHTQANNKQTEMVKLDFRRKGAGV